MPELPPTDEELERALDDLFYAANQCAMYHFWFLWARPIVRGHQEVADLRLDTFIGNGVIEATLLFVRKSAEFFKPQEPSDKTDTIYSYRYRGYAAQEWIVPRATTYAELHKRVGHVTIRQARYGAVEWEVFPMVVTAMRKWARFFEALAAISSPSNPNRGQQCAAYARSLDLVISRMERDVQNQAKA